MSATIDREKIRRITAEVLEELTRQRPGAFPASRVSAGSFTADAFAGAAPVAPSRPKPDPRTGISTPRPAAASASLRPEELGVSPEGRPTVTCNISARHIHLKQEHVEALFGAGANLTVRNQLMQPGQFASEQTVSVIAGRGRVIESVRILGPARRYSQVELARTDCVYLGIRTPVRNSGDHDGTAGGTLVGPKGTLVLPQGVIIADRHIHTPPALAEQLGLADNQFIRVRVFHTEKPTILERVRIRIDPDFALEMHLDTDDANACGVTSGDRVELLLD